MDTQIVAAAMRGFALGLGLIVAIGAQNAFILERGLVRNHVFVLCLLCALSDALLIAAGVGGVGTLIATRPVFIEFATAAGAVFLASYALIALRRALAPEGMAVRGARLMALCPAVATVLALTFLNPHVYLDTVMLIGSLSAAYSERSERIAFGSGAATASFLWFFGLGYGARLLAPLFARPAAWRVLDFCIAAIMAALAASLVLSLV